MQCECEQFEDRSVVRLHNRALRSVNRGLRRAVERLKEHSDELFVALCGTDVRAKQAFGELWGSALFDCGPEDYDYMVEEIEKAFAFVEAHKHINPVPPLADK